MSRAVIKSRIRWQAQKAPGFCKRLGKSTTALCSRDDIEQIAMFTGRCIGPFARRSLAHVDKADIETSARCIVHIADQPIAPLTSPAVEIVTAHSFGPGTKALRDI